MLRLLLLFSLFNLIYLKTGDEWFQQLLASHLMACRKSCDMIPDYLDSCCGSCDCDAECKKHGSCCLYQYSSFEDALENSRQTRYECVKPQYLSGAETKYNRDGVLKYWMVTRCDPNYKVKLSVVELCNNPGLDGSVESVVPVTLFSTSKIFRNKYCALCNWVDINKNIMYWKLEIHSNFIVTLPDPNLVKKIESSRGNIFFKPPIISNERNYLCFQPTYTISKCNETGLWIKYNKYIERACHSFTDTYNQTYKNYFCHLCNGGAKHYYESFCPIASWSDDEGPPPRHRVTINTGTVLGSQHDNTFRCESDQFQDQKQNICRDLLCFTHEYLPDYGCETEDTCYEVYVTMTVTSKLKPPVSAMNDKLYMNGFVYALTTQIPNFLNKVSKLKIFYHAERHGFVDYLVLYLNVLGSIENSREAEVSKGLFLHNKTIFVDVFNIFTQEEHEYNLQIRAYNMTITDETASISILNRLNPSNIDKLFNSNFTFDSTEYCYNRESNSFNKLRACPYVKIHKQDFVFSSKEGYLTIADLSSRTKPLIGLYPWQYLEAESHFLICVEDFGKLYGALPSQNNISTSASSQSLCLMFLFFYLHLLADFFH